MGLVRAFTSPQTSWMWDFIVNAVIIDSFCSTFFFKQQLERLIYCVITKMVLIHVLSCLIYMFAKDHKECLSYKNGNMLKTGLYLSAEGLLAIWMIKKESIVKYISGGS